MLTVHNFSYGLLTPLAAYLMSCVGCFLGLRFATRARAVGGLARARWLLAAALSIGVTGIWVMHFIAMLGFTVPGRIIEYNVPITVLSMMSAVIVVSAGLLIVGFSGNGALPLMTGGLVLGLGVASVHYLGMAAMSTPGMAEHYRAGLVALSALIAVVGGTAALWAATHLRGLRSTLLAAPILGIAVSGMHYTGMAAVQMETAVSATTSSDGVSGTALLLPLIIVIGVVTFLLIAVISVAPTEAEIREDAALDWLARRAGLAWSPPGQADRSSPQTTADVCWADSGDSA